MVISMLFEQIGMSKKDGISQDLKVNQLKKKSKDMENIISLIESSMNPFSGQISGENLYNIGSGKETEGFLLNCQNVGMSAMETFIKECIGDKKNRF